MVQHSSLSCIAIDNRLMNLTDFSFDQEKVLAFLQWLDTSFPADPSVSAPKLWCKFGSSLGNVLLMNWVLRQYASPGMMDRDGPIFLRPWHLPCASECGLKGVLEPASCHHNYRWLLDNVMLILKVLFIFRFLGEFYNHGSGHIAVSQPADLHAWHDYRSRCARDRKAGHLQIEEGIGVLPKIWVRVCRHWSWLRPAHAASRCVFCKRMV